MKFLHLSDVHLGCARYQLAESPRDFFDAWYDVLQKYAIGEKVDFVMMCGDFFDKRNVPPETMNYAVAGLTTLRDASIPVVAIEGNHDQKYRDSKYSWLRSLANWDLLYLLEPKNVDGKAIYEPWSEGSGGFIDIGQARIFGSEWYGASANWAIPMLTAGIAAHRRDGAFHILMLHTDVEGHQTHPIPALSIAALKELKAVTEYVGLGHTHMHFEIDNWAFNPGSIEVTNISDYRESRGVFLVEVDDANKITAKHISDYRQRPFQRLGFEVGKFSNPQELADAFIEQCNREVRHAENGQPAPIVEITLRGQLGFPNSQLEVKRMREEVQKITSALAVRLKNQTVPIEYAIAPDVEESTSREKLERRVIEDLIRRDKRFTELAAKLPDTVIGAKRLALGDEEPEKIAEFIGITLEGDAA